MRVLRWLKEGEVSSRTEPPQMTKVSTVIALLPCYILIVLALARETGALQRRSGPEYRILHPLRDLLPAADSLRAPLSIAAHGSGNMPLPRGA